MADPFFFGVFGSLAKSKSFRERCLAARKGSFSFIEKSFCIFANASGSTTCVYPLSKDQGAIFGKIFQKKSAKEVSDLSLEVDSLGQQFWGKYVGASFDEKTGSFRLFRDPLGLSTLFYVTTPEGVIFSSDLSILHDLLDVKPSIHWDYFMQHIHSRNQVLGMSPFKNVHELLPGTVLSVDLSMKLSSRSFWGTSQNPSLFIRNQEDFERQLLEMLKTSIEAWGASSKGICVELSGGTDSSAVLLLLKEIFPQKKIVPIHYCDSKRNGENEVLFAEEVAKVCDLPLTLFDLEGDRWVESLPKSWRPNRPWGCLHSAKKMDQINALLESHGCDLIMNGQGGDHVFLAPPPLSSLIDLGRSRRWNLFPKVIKELSSFYRMPWFEVIKHARQEKPGVSLTSPYLHPNCLQKISQREFRGGLPGKEKQIDGLTHAIAYAERDEFPIRSSYCHPLLSQPLVELALTIPTYQSFEDGFDRIFFRKALTQMNSGAPVWRRRKGSNSVDAFQTFSSDLEKIREILQEGSLVKNEIINKKKVKEELARIEHGQLDGLWPILHILECQKWLNQWEL